MISVLCILPGDVEEIHDFDVAPRRGDLIDLDVDSSYVVMDRILSPLGVLTVSTVVRLAPVDNDEEPHLDFLCKFPGNREETRTFLVAPAKGDKLKIKGDIYYIIDRIIPDKEDESVILYLELVVD